MKLAPVNNKVPPNSESNHSKLVPAGGFPDKEAVKEAVVFVQILVQFTTISKLFMFSLGIPIPPPVAPLGIKFET